MPAKITSEYAETLVTGTSKLHLKGEYVETLVTGTPKARFQAEYVEVLVSTLPRPTLFLASQGAIGLKLGSTNVSTAYIGSTQVYGPFVFTDRFNRVDATTLGAPWVAPNWGVKTNLASINTPVGDSVKMAYLETNRVDCTVRVVLGSITTNTDYYGPAGRLIDASNGYVVQVSAPTQQIAILKFTGGSGSTISSTVSYTPAVNDVLDLVFSGPTITLLVNGVVKTSVSDVTYMGTKHGFWAYVAGATKFDNFAII